MKSGGNKHESFHNPEKVKLYNLKFNTGIMHNIADNCSERTSEWHNRRCHSIP